VNRGPASAAVLRRLMGYGDAARCLLGNHDLSLLAVAHGTASAAPQRHHGQRAAGADRDALLDWLRHQPWRSTRTGS
jgi:bis(5'-nucleosyl)-tetraphosphatase (symmetrical)